MNKTILDKAARRQRRLQRVTPVRRIWNTEPKRESLTTLYVKHKFSAAHCLEFYNGPCANLHGHTFEVEVWLTGVVGCSGMLVDFKEVKAELDIFDHKHINNVVSYNPTAENIAKDFCDRLSIYPGVHSVTVRVWESEEAYAEVSSS